jgi:outer membrane protein assembly factor BamB
VYAADFKKSRAYEAETGKMLWEGSSSNGYNAPTDLLLINDLVWMSGKGARRAIDPKTGEAVKSIKNAGGYMHARCYRNKGTEKFIMMGLMGVQMIDLDNGEIHMNDWVRGTCQFGVMPANGMLYVPPDSCACNMKTKLSGIYALSSSTEKPLSTPNSGPLLEKVAAKLGDWPTYRANPARGGAVDTTIPATLGTTWKNKVGGKLSGLTVANGHVYVAAVDRYEIHAIDEASGKTVWTFTSGGRIDSPPSIYNGIVYFGSADGWVYALRQTDGVLAWRFRGGPSDRHVVVRGRLESVWPVHGNALVHEDSVVVAAGRSSYLDGGIHLYRLDPVTGKTLSATTIFSPDDKGKQPPNGGRDVRGVLNDVLLADGSDVYMRQCKLDFETGSDEGSGIHLFTPIGFLDDTWWHRAYWVFNNEFKSHWSGWWRVGNSVPSGRILSYDDDFIYGFGRSAYPGGNTGQWRGGEKYQLFAVNRSQPAALSRQPTQDRRGQNPPKKKNRRPKPPPKAKNLWTTQVPLLATSLAVTKGAVYAAGPPNMFDAKAASGEAALKLTDPATALAAWQGKKGGILYGASASDGKKLVQMDLPSPAVFDGMAAANEALFLSLRNGEVICIKGK